MHVREVIPSEEIVAHEEAQRPARVAGRRYGLDAGRERRVGANLELDGAHVDVGPVVGSVDVRRVHHARHRRPPRLPLVVVGDVVHVRQEHQVRRAAAEALDLCVAT